MTKEKHGITLKELIRQRDLAVEGRNETDDREYKADYNNRIDRINDAIKRGEYDK